jgi:hypothetical protein
LLGDYLHMSRSVRAQDRQSPGFSSLVMRFSLASGVIWQLLQHDRTQDRLAWMSSGLYIAKV